MTGRLAGGAALGVAMVLSGAAAAQQPEPWQVTLQPAASPIAEMIHRFNDGLMITVTVIVVFILALLLWCMVRYNARANPVPSKTSHNTVIEVIWTIVPVLILIAIAIPSFGLLFAQFEPARAIPGFDPAKDEVLTVKATGNQWFWSYEYPDNGDIVFDSLMLTDAERTDPATQPRLLAVNNQMVVPVSTVIRMQVIANDVIHAFAVPAFGIKIDAVPGRLNETWFRADREGTYYGQCSELCGRDHAFMPIAVRVVSREVFDAWAAAAANDIDAAKQLLSAADTAQPERIASR